MGFGELQTQKVENYWTNGDEEFLPWLVSEIRADSDSELESVLDANLEVVESGDVGSYGVDLLVRDVETGRRLVVEDFVTTRERDPLRSIAGAADLGADGVVWIGSEFDDAHLDAIQWLTARGREGVEFVPIQMEIWRIGDSEPAVRLKRVALDAETVTQYEGAPVEPNSGRGSLEQRMRSFNRWLRRSFGGDSGQL